jgi:uncharacterized protein (TIGR02186 family)
LGDRVLHRLYRRGDGHRRRISAGAHVDLSVAGADRPVIGTSMVLTLVTMASATVMHAATNHLVDAVLALILMIGGVTGAQFRRPRRPEDARRAAASPARLAGVGGWDSFCARPHIAARAYIPFGRRIPAHEPQLVAPLLVPAALVASEAPAAAERLVASLSNHRDGGSNFTGEELVLFGGIEQDGAARLRRGGYDIVVTVTGPRHHRHLPQGADARHLGECGSRVFEDAPAYLAVLTSRPLDAIASTETLRRLRLGLDQIPLPQQASVNIAAANSDDPFRVAFIRINRPRPLSGGHERRHVLAPTLFRASIPLRPRSRSGLMRWT